MKPPRSPAYLRFVRSHPCCVCRTTQRIEAAHTGPHGISQKASDYSAIPLCPDHHRAGRWALHRGRRAFESFHDLDINEIARRLNEEYFGRLEPLAAAIPTTHLFQEGL